MILDPQSSIKAADLVNGLYEKELADLIWKLGEERLAKKLPKKLWKPDKEKLKQPKSEILFFRSSQKLKGKGFIQQPKLFKL